MDLLKASEETRQDAFEQMMEEGLIPESHYVTFARKLELCTVYIFRGNKLDLPITIASHKGSSQEKALVDSGTMENFIDPGTIRCLKLGVHKLMTPINLNVHNIDGTKNNGGKITSYLNLIASQGNKKISEQFYVTNLRGDRIILGYPWLQDFNPQIDWPNHKLIGPSARFDTTFNIRFPHLREMLVEKLQIRGALPTNDVANLKPSEPTPEKPLGIQHEPDPDPHCNTTAVLG